MERTDLKQNPLLEDVKNLKEVVWINPERKPFAEAGPFAVTAEEMEEAEALWQRFAPFFEKAFPETAKAAGIVESPIREISKMKKALEFRAGGEFEGDYFLKCDSELPVAGSIKARGGVFEVLHHAEQLAKEAGLLKRGDSYEKFAGEEFKAFFGKRAIGVGSTGNLGLSIGTISAALGFKVTVYMSADAKQWKKDLLRERGAEVVEFEGDFSEAITAGRNRTLADPEAYFVDDEKSKLLFLGYSTAAFRLKRQLEEQGIDVSKDRPLFVYLPCGVGGSPGGITFGLKQLYGDAVHCFFVEPTHSPAMLTGLLTGKMNEVSVQDFGIDNRTEADGLAVGRPSALASPICRELISGIWTIEDDELYRLLALLEETEGVFVEPSATAGLPGPLKVKASGYAEELGLDMEHATHIAWATGGSLVPTEDREAFYAHGKRLLDK
ncbi:D-serine ammonia-lyase [Indiicoccus explosivorum]|uniref:D-serine ammonia-lyase n=1 Tax=Indiicoccus explosivorum TaxID=1917864 RepID=UPI001185410C|nr:D-serine ammonia-lyase [Indiicoccus explosivorum]